MGLACNQEIPGVIALMSPTHPRSDPDATGSLNRAAKAYSHYAVRQLAAIERGDSKSAIAAMRAVNRARRQLAAAGAEGQRLILSFLRHRHPAVRVLAATDALRFAPSRALPVLRELRSAPGAVGLDAEGALFQWKRESKRRKT